MTKLIFIFALTISSLASACKISPARVSASIITHVTQDALGKISPNSSIQAVYFNAKSEYYVVEILDENAQCATKLFDAQFDTVECDVKVNEFTSSFFTPVCRN